MRLSCMLLAGLFFDSYRFEGAASVSAADSDPDSTPDSKPQFSDFDSSLGDGDILSCQDSIHFLKYAQGVKKYMWKKRRLQR